VSLVVVKFFVIKDGTGEIAVVTDRILPKQNALLSQLQGK
jgi:hypothetical protein